MKNDDNGANGAGGGDVAVQSANKNSIWNSFFFWFLLPPILLQNESKQNKKYFCRLANPLNIYINFYSDFN